MEVDGEEFCAAPAAPGAQSPSGSLQTGARCPRYSPPVSLFDRTDGIYDAESFNKKHFSHKLISSQIPAPSSWLQMEARLPDSPSPAQPCPGDVSRLEPKDKKFAKWLENDTKSGGKADGSRAADIPAAVTASQARRKGRIFHAGTHLCSARWGSRARDAELRSAGPLRPLLLPQIAAFWHYQNEMVLPERSGCFDSAETK